MDLAHLTNLKILDVCSTWMTDKIWNLLDRALSSISSSRLEELDICYRSDESISLDLILATATFAHLRSIDDTLARPQFARLHHVKLHCKFHILIQAILITSDPSPSPSLDSVAPNPGSTSQPDPSNELSHTQSDSLHHDLDDSQQSFQFYAECLVRHRIQEGLKQLCAHGILDFEVRVFPKRPSNAVPKSDGRTLRQ